MIFMCFKDFVLMACAIILCIFKILLKTLWKQESVLMVIAAFSKSCKLKFLLRT